MADFWLRFRYSKRIRQLGDAIWTFHHEYRNPMEYFRAKLNIRRQDMLSELARLGSERKVRHYLLKKYGWWPFELVPALPEIPKPEPTPAVCPFCGHTELDNVGFAMWDGADRDGKPAFGIDTTGTCAKCGYEISFPVGHGSKNP